MTVQMFWIIFGIFVLGITITGNLFILMLCLLQAAKRHDVLVESLLVAPVTIED